MKPWGWVYRVVFSAGTGYLAWRLMVEVSDHRYAAAAWVSGCLVFAWFDVIAARVRP